MIEMGRLLLSPKDWFMFLVMCLAALGASLKAQLPGQVTVLDTSHTPWSFLCSVEADPSSENIFYFDLPALVYDDRAQLDFDPDGHCADGCSWDWDIVGGHIEGLFVTLPHDAEGNGNVAFVDGWPIIDNIDFRRAAPDGMPSLDAMGLDVSPDLPTSILVTDLSGRVVFAQNIVQGVLPSLPELPHGIYVVMIQTQNRWTVRKIAR